MAMNSNLPRALHSSHAHARPILASALRGLIYAALPRLSTVAANPMICSLRLFSVFRPAPSPTRKPKPTTKADTVRPVEQRAKKILGPYKLTKEPSAASPKHMTASRAREREKKEKLTAYEGTMKELMAHVMKIKELRAELMNIPEQPKGATSPYACFVRHCYQSSAVIGRAGSVNNEVTAMWKALSDTELQQFTKEASDINQLRAAEYNEWAQAVGYITIRKINRDRVRSGKEKLRIPASVQRPVRKVPRFTTFFLAKVASGEVSTLEGRPAAMKHAGVLWRQLTPSEQAVYEAQSVANYKQKLADFSHI